jgi:tRNA U34 5-carboxymethylaminomethyl modifying enzyme MnmG/GidA
MSKRDHFYDVLIVGAGVCGSEAALGCAAAGLDTLLITTSLDTVYNLLGEAVRLEPKAGTFMAESCLKLVDEQGRISSWAMHRAAKQRLESSQGIHLLQSNVSALLVEAERVIGVKTWEGVPRFARRVALCVGSFLQARLRIGTLTESAGRLSEMAYDELYDDLLKAGFLFRELQLEASPTTGSLSYSVTCKVLVEGAVDPSTFAVKGLEQLYAAGICAFGYMPFEEAAAQGKDLAKVLSS